MSKKLDAKRIRYTRMLAYLKSLGYIGTEYKPENWLFDAEIDNQIISLKNDIWACEDGYRDAGLKLPPKIGFKMV